MRVSLHNIFWLLCPESDLTLGLCIMQPVATVLPHNQPTKERRWRINVSLCYRSDCPWQAALEGNVSEVNSSPFSVESQLQHPQCMQLQDGWNGQVVRRINPPPCWVKTRLSPEGSACIVSLAPLMPCMISRLGRFWKTKATSCHLLCSMIA